MKRYSVYGVKLGSDYPFAVPLPATDDEAELLFETTSDPTPSFSLDEHRPIYVEGRRPDGGAQFEFYDLGDHSAVRLSGTMDFFCWPERIVCHLREAKHSYLVEIALFGMIMALWLEQRGVPTLHASTVVMDGQAVGFLSSRGGGKTSTAAACVSAGHPLLGDDLLPLKVQAGQVVGEPGFPQMRMWPEQARHFVVSPEGRASHRTFHPGHDKLRVTIGTHFGAFYGKATPIRKLYLPELGEERDAEIIITRLETRQAAMALVRHSFLPREVVSYGLQRSRFAFFARLLATVSICRVAVPLGMDQLPRVVNAIEVDMQA